MVSFYKEPTIEELRNKLDYERKRLEREKDFSLKLFVALLIVIIIAIATNVFQLWRYDKLYDEYAFTYSLYEECFYEAQFYEVNGIVICSDKNPYYHNYNCYEWNQDSYIVANYKNALAVGFTPCPDCEPMQ